ncbi:MAG: transglycosylase SLT domain-containing protein [Salinispira sp.]
MRLLLGLGAGRRCARRLVHALPRRFYALDITINPHYYYGMQVGWVTTFLLLVLSLAGSVSYSYKAPEKNRNFTMELLEARMNQKSKKIAFFIPPKISLRAHDEPAQSFEFFPHSPDPTLQLYGRTDTRDAVIDFFISLVGSEDVAIPVIYYANKQRIPLLTAFSLMYVESRFLPEAVNVNRSSIDRGIFQLNSRSFPHLQETDFFDPSLNAHYAMTYLRWCMTHSSNEEEALAMYNAGYGNIKRGYIPESTKRYIQKIYTYRKTLTAEFYQYLDISRNPPAPAASSARL